MEPKKTPKWIKFYFSGTAEVAWEEVIDYAPTLRLGGRPIEDVAKIVCVELP